MKKSKDAIVISTLDGSIIDVNPAGISLFGYSYKEDLMSANCQIELMVNPDDRRQIREQLEQKGHVQELELIMKKDNGEQFTAIISASLVKTDNNDLTLCMAIIRDVTEYKKLERQLFHSQKLEAIGTLASGIAHDFNNLLSPILGYADILQRQLSENSQAYSNTKRIIAAAENAKNLVKQILTVNYDDEVEKCPICISSVIKETLEFLRSTLPVSIYIRDDIERDILVEANSTQIAQVVINLITNSYHAIGDQKGEISVNLKCVTKNSGIDDFDFDLVSGIYVQLTVRDTGCGMDQSIIDLIFDPFYTTKPKTQGTGLGLYVVHGIIKNHGGAITVKSKFGKGTEFKIFFAITSQ